MRFPVRYNLKTILLIIGAVLAISFLLVPMAVKAFNYSWEVYALFTLLAVIQTILMPYLYVIDKDNFIIRRFLFPIKIKISEIESLRRIEKEEMRYTGKPSMNVGFFGYSGRYTNDVLKDFKMYSGSMKDLILITTTNGNKIVVSGDDKLYSALEGLISTETI